MKNAGYSLLGTLAVVAVGVFALSHVGFLDVRWPWQNPDIVRREATVGPVKEARIVKVEPIALDCRARIHAEVPVEGREEHKVFGATYRTDTVTMEAVGDIDTCVDASAVEVIEAADGSFRVIVPAEAIQFVRPRVDAVATLDTVHFDKGFVGKLTDALPWVSDNSGLTPAAYAYAQSVIGSSECMSHAYDVTERAMVQAYREQLAGQGGDPSLVQVDVIGEPDFGAPAGAEFEGFDFEVADGGVLCTVDQSAYLVAPQGTTPDA